MAEINVTLESFEAEVINSPVPVLVDFWATWCGPCMMLAPTISEIAEEGADSLKVCKVDVDAEASLAAAFGIQSIPTVLAFEKGEIVGTSVGVATKEKLLSMIY